MDLSPLLTGKPWYLPLALWQSSMDTISAKSYARLECVRIHTTPDSNTRLAYRDGVVTVQKGDHPEYVLLTDLKRLEDYHALLRAADEVAPHLPQDWQPVSLSDRPTWYRRSGFRVVLPITCNVYYCPGGEWGRYPAIDLGAVSA